MDSDLVKRLAVEACFEVSDDGRILSLAQDEDITRRLEHFASLAIEDALRVAIGALADIGYSDDITLERARRKAQRIYIELTAKPS